jgi:hypothetical protein
VELDRQACALDVRDERVQAQQARLRRERQLVVVGSQHPEEPPHLAERSLTRRLDGVESGTRLVRLTLEQPPAATRLHHDDTNRVGNYVVELAGDPRALLGDCGPRALLLLALERAGAFLQRSLP